MKKRILCLLLCAALLLPLSACGRKGGYRVVDTYSGEGDFYIAFRKDDALCQIISAALKELAANGTLRTASLTWFGEDIVGLRGESGAMDEYWDQVEPRTLIVGVNPNSMPLSYEEGDGFAGFDVDVVNYICGFLGWSMILRPIGAEDVDVQLQSGNIDCAMGVAEGLMNTSYFSYSPSYLEGKYVLVTSLGSSIRSKGGLRNKVLGVVMSDLDILNSDERFASRLDRVIYQTGTQGLFDALNAGEVDGILVSGAMASYYLR